MNLIHKRLLFGVTLVAAVISVASLAPANDQSPDATISFSGGSIAAADGLAWGDGILQFDGKTYPFAVSGVSALDVGTTTLEGTGEVYNLRSLDDFAGNYVTDQAGDVLAAAGAQRAAKNQHGVVIDFQPTTAGLPLELSPSGISVRLKP